MRRKENERQRITNTKEKKLDEIALWGVLAKRIISTTIINDLKHMNANTRANWNFQV